MIPHHGPLVALALIGVVALQLLLVWSFPFPPTQDGGVHLQNGHIINRLNAHEPQAERFFERQPSAAWLGESAVALMLKALSPTDAERALATCWVVGWAAVMWWSAGPLAALLAAPLALGYLFHLGFYSFCAGTAGFALALGHCRRRPGMHLPGSLVTTGILFATTLAHPLAGTCAIVAVAGAALARAWATTPTPNADRVRVVLRSFLAVGLASLPSAAWVIWTRLGSPPAAPLGWPFPRRLTTLLTLDVVSALDRREMILSIALAALLGVLVVAAARASRLRWAPGDELLGGALLILALYFFAPNHFVTQAGGTTGGWILHRLSLLFVVATLCWLGGRLHAGSLVRWATLLALLIAVVQLGLHRGSWSRIHDLYREMDDVTSHVPWNAQYVTQVLDSRGVPGRRVSDKVAVFEHVGARLGLGGTRIDLGNFSATTAVFPVAYRREVSPQGLLWRPGSRLIAPTDYEASTGVRIDAVLIWGLPPEYRSDPRLASFFSELEALGFSIGPPSPRGWANVATRSSH